MPSLKPLFEAAVSKCTLSAALFSHVGPLLLLFFFLTACATRTQVLGENEHYLVLVAGEGETPKSLAAAFLGDPQQDWRIEDANGGATIKAGQQLVIPRKSSNLTGVFDDGYQTVPILSYHRFGAGKGRFPLPSGSLKSRWNI